MVNRIIARVEIISQEGRFEIKDLMRAADNLRINRLSAVIDRDLVYKPPAARKGRDRV